MPTKPPAPQPTPSEELLLAALAALHARGEPLSSRAIQAETGFDEDKVRYVKRSLRRRGLMPAEYVFPPPGSRSGESRPRRRSASAMPPRAPRPEPLPGGKIKVDDGTPKWTREKISAETIRHFRVQKERRRGGAPPGDGEAEAGPGRHVGTVESMEEWRRRAGVLIYGV